MLVLEPRHTHDICTHIHTYTHELPKAHDGMYPTRLRMESWSSSSGSFSCASLTISNNALNVIATRAHTKRLRCDAPITSQTTASPGSLPHPLKAGHVPVGLDPFHEDLPRTTEVVHKRLSLTRAFRRPVAVGPRSTACAGRRGRHITVGAAGKTASKGHQRRLAPPSTHAA